MARKEQKADKRARKKEEEARKKREREQNRKSKPDRILTDYARSLVAAYPESSVRRQQFERDFYLFLLRVKRLPFAASWQEALEYIAKAHQETPGTIACKRGCSACCHQSVGLSPAEGQQILEHLQAHPLEIDWDLVAKQAAATDYQRLSFAERRCVFLGQEGECRIYELRPLTCRRYVVTSEPEHCYAEAKEKLTSSMHTECEAYLSAFLTHYGHVSLPDLLQDFRKGS